MFLDLKFSFFLFLSVLLRFRTPLLIILFYYQIASVATYDNILNTENTLPTIEAEEYRNRAFIGYSLFNAISYDELSGEYPGIQFQRSLNTRRVNNREVEGLRLSIAQNGLLSKEEDKCLHIFCHADDVMEDSIIQTWCKDDLKPIKFTKDTKLVQLANGAHRIDTLQKMHESFSARIAEIRVIVAQWRSTSNANTEQKERIEQSENDIHDLERKREMVTYWAIKVYDLGKCCARHLHIDIADTH